MTTERQLNKTIDIEDDKLTDYLDILMNSNISTTKDLPTKTVPTDNAEHVDDVTTGPLIYIDDETNNDTVGDLNNNQHIETTLVSNGELNTKTKEELETNLTSTGKTSSERNVDSKDNKVQHDENSKICYYTRNPYVHILEKCSNLHENY